MTRWIDRLSPAEQAELTDAGRIGSARFAGPDVFKPAPNPRFAAPFSGAFVTDLDPRDPNQMEVWPDD